ncbi:MAG: 2-amino-3,7-dideoxy-D-threo-hept-6-ulosonate synthase [Promethearchaeota archaeon]
MNGKEVRLSRILRNGKALIIPMDHGVSMGPVKGLVDMNDTVSKVVEGGASAVLLHKGIIRSLKTVPNCGLIAHFSASTALGPDSNKKVRTGSVEEAIRLGVDAVSLHINIGCKTEPEMLLKLGEFADKCDQWQIPLIAMMYARGENVKDPLDSKTIAMVARIGAELGADIVKCNYTGSPETFKDIVRGCPVPIVIAGGEKADNDRAVLEMVEGAMKSGCIGLTFGRNVFQHDNPIGIVQAIAKIVYDEWTVDETLEVVKI